MRRFLEIVVIVLERADVYQPFHGERLGLREEPVVRHAGDDRVQLAAYPLAHVREQLQLNEFALGRFSAAFGLAAMFAERGELHFIAARPPRAHPAID